MSTNPNLLLVFFQVEIVKRKVTNEKNSDAMPYLGGGNDDVAESWSAHVADVWISQQSLPYYKRQLFLYK